MKNSYLRHSYRRRNVTKLPVYKKAIHIFKLSRQIVEYLRGDTSVLELHKSQNQKDIYSDKLIMTSLGLAPKIAMAETSPDLNVKLASLSSLEQTTAALIQYCEKLELKSGKGKEFLHLLRTEIKKFGHLQSKWAVSIHSKN
ncbi:hypothetical protein [Galbibacter sp. BG1]|uniref:hypothetical protein n=1 Tax=Galbibacter sp. BG1 TaxID=1170699 RepID=UPI0021037335|nr:hypothetical protein [Galbibacter sp. BG1]